jgi:hypothetical protein
VIQSTDQEQCDDANCDECDPLHPQRPVPGDSCNNMCGGLICKDPAKIKLTSGLDVLTFHAQMIPFEGAPIDFAGAFAIGLTTDEGLVFEQDLPAGVVEADGRNARYRNPAAKKNGGIFKLKAVRTSANTYKVIVTAYGDLSGVQPDVQGDTQVDIVTTVTVSGREWTLHGLWSQLRSGWRFDGNTVLP